MNCTAEEISKMIDHAILSPQTTIEEAKKSCKIATKFNVASVCCKPYFLPWCVEELFGTNTVPSTVIGFPHGGQSTAIKTREALQALKDGAVELDMVVNIGEVVNNNWPYVNKEIDEVVKISRLVDNTLLKIIFENCYLTDEQKIKLCNICTDAGVNFVKTSTGYGERGATVEDVQLMRKHVPKHIGVKAAGGIRDLKTLLTLVKAGANRIGVSRTAFVMEEALKTKLTLP